MEIFRNIKLGIPPTGIYGVLTIVCMGFFLAAASCFIGSPGFYYDEVIFAPVSYVIAGQSIPAPIGLKFHGLPITQQPIYVGALKAYLMAPILAFFGSSYLTLRLPMIISGAFCLWMLAAFLKRRLGFWAAASVLVLAATDPLFIFATKIDWGPTTLAALFRCLAIGFLFRFFEKKQSCDMAFFLAACALGFWDKSNFLWVMIALVIASIVFYRHILWNWLYSTPKLKVILTVVPFVYLYGLIIKRIVIKCLNFNMPAHPLSAMDCIERIGSIFQLYVGSASGQDIFYFLFGTNLPYATLLPWLVPVSVVWGLVISLPCRLFENVPHRREAGFISLVILIIFAQAVATPQTGGPHHMVVFWPLTHILFVLCCVTISHWMKGKTWVSGVGRITPFVLLAGFCVWAIYIDCQTLAAMKAGNETTLFRPEISQLSAKIKELDIDKIYSIDWGIGNQLVVLSDRDDRKKYEDMWPLFSDSSIQTEHPAWLQERLMGNVTRAIFVSFAEDSTWWPQNHLARDKVLASWHPCLWQKIYIPRITGEALYRIDLIEACPGKL